jgi:hypothetical protein
MLNLRYDKPAPSQTKDTLETDVAPNALYPSVCTTLLAFEGLLPKAARVALLQKKSALTAFPRTHSSPCVIKRLLSWHFNDRNDLPRVSSKERTALDQPISRRFSPTALSSVGGVANLSIKKVDNALCVALVTSIVRYHADRHSVIMKLS